MQILAGHCTLVQCKIKAMYHFLMQKHMATVALAESSVYLYFLLKKRTGQHKLHPQNKPGKKCEVNMEENSM